MKLNPLLRLYLNTLPLNNRIKKITIKISKLDEKCPIKKNNFECKLKVKICNSHCWFKIIQRITIKNLLNEIEFYLANKDYINLAKNR